MNIKSLKILCLHGFRHNSQLLKKSMEPIIKRLSIFDVEFDFLDSPIKYKSEQNNTDYRKWWSVTKENALTLEKYDTIEESILHVKNKWTSNKYDGLLGFSQGSILAQIFAYQVQNKVINLEYEPKFIILVNTSLISDINYKVYYQEQLLYKTLIISGSKDTSIDIEHLCNLIKNFKNISVIFNTGGRYFSTTTETYYPLRHFLKEIT